MTTIVAEFACATVILVWLPWRGTPGGRAGLPVGDFYASDASILALILLDMDSIWHMFAKQLSNKDLLIWGSLSALFRLSSGSLSTVGGWKSKLKFLTSSPKQAQMDHVWPQMKATGHIYQLVTADGYVTTTLLTYRCIQQGCRVIYTTMCSRHMQQVP